MKNMKTVAPESPRVFGRKRTGALAAGLIFVLTVLAVSSCGSGGKDSSDTASSAKLPPGTTAESVERTSVSSSGGSSGNVSSSADAKKSSAASSSHQEGVTLEKVNFTLTKVTRTDSNSAVVSGNARELEGDFLQIELTINNASGGLVKLNDFSFRLYSPAIDASSYEEYYGGTTTYGGYVKKNTISAALLSESSLQRADYVLRDGETVDEVFLFYDLNPLSIDTNDAFGLQGAELIIYDTATGKSVSVSLAGFAR